MRTRLFLLFAFAAVTVLTNAASAGNIAHGVEFLQEGSKLKVTIMFKGREMAHPEKGFELVDKITESLKDKGVLDAPGKLLGRNICVSYSPVK